MNRFQRLPALLVLLAAFPASACASGDRPDLDYFQVRAIPLEGHDAPAISNNWLWAQAANGHARGILNMEDVRPGGRPQFHGTTIVRVGGQPLVADPRTADWWPNKVLRRAKVDGIEYAGIVAAAAEKYALLSRLTAANTTAQPKTISLEVELIANEGLHGTVEEPSSRRQDEKGSVCRFENVVIGPGASVTFRAVHLYRSEQAVLEKLLARFDDEWTAADAYWNRLLEDAFTPGPGPYLSGGAPRFITRRGDTQRFYNFGVVTALMLLKRDPDGFCPSNLYVTAMPDANYGTRCYMWDVGYASEVLAMLDPEALTTTLEHWAALGPHSMLAFWYDSGQPSAPGRFYASNGSMFFLSAWNYVNYTGDFDWLNKKVADKTMLQHLREAVDWHKTRPQWNGLAHYGEERNLFDDHTVVGYHHFVAAPNAACVGIKRRLADIYEKLYHDEANARQLRQEARQLAEALIQHLYNDQGSHAGTWKQRHQDGSMLEIRHSWDFMNAGTYLADDLSLKQKRQMRDWFVDNLVRFGSDDVWVVAQDPRDGNNGRHQMEHNGRGAYPAWPYHDGWALKAMGFHQDVIDLLRVIDGIPRMGAIGQGYHPGGRRCRSNWVNASGTTAAAFLTRNVFGVAPGLGEFRPNVKLGDFDPDARLEDVPVKGTLFQVSREGAVATGRLPQLSANVL